MDLFVGQNTVAQAVARAMLEGFNKHYRLFRESCISARARFEEGDWAGVQREVKARIPFYDDRVAESVSHLRATFSAESLDEITWQQVKLLYVGLLLNHKQPELAETFFNSVFCRIMHRTYFHNDFIFVRPAISTEYIDSDPPIYRSYYPNSDGLRSAVRQVFLDFEWTRPFANLNRDVERILQTVKRSLGEWPQAEANCQIQVLHSPFYRNKAAYVVGNVVNGHQEYPFAAAVLHDVTGRLVIDTILLDVARINVLFSLSRAYFLVDMEVPSGYVQFLGGIMPTKSRAELYTMLGLAKQGKTMFYRDLIHHLHHSADEFVVAPGIPGLVMLVFTLPSFPYVFKVIKDVFAPPKEVDHATVKAKYLLVKKHDRVGRMADTLEFSDVALPRARFSERLIGELYQKCGSLLEEDAGNLIIKHLYIERRMQPLNMYLDRASEDQIDHAVREYGNAIRELALTNIFPGDLLWKNFGVTRYGRVVFYDYDEIEYLSDCNFRRIPPAPNPEFEMSGEAWYAIAPNDVFPEEFASFLLGNPEVRRAFLKHHPDLLGVEFWQRAQEKVFSGKMEDFYPYPESLRFVHTFAEADGQAGDRCDVSPEA